jgi:hypothetical protein
LQDVELQYNKRMSIIERHRTALGKNLGVMAAFSWSPAANNAFNRITALGANDSMIDAIIDLEAFYKSLDMYTGLNLCLTPAHMARIKKEDKNLFKDILNTRKMYGFDIFEYTKNPLYTSANAKKPFGAVAEAGDKVASFSWVSSEVFRCFGDTEMYATLGSASIQADEISFAQRALVGKIRSTNPKYLGAIL